MSEDDKLWQKDAYCFAYNLYSFLFRKRGMSQHMPPPVAGCDGTSYYTEEAGKTVLYTWHMSRDMYRHICMATYPAFAKNRNYLLVFLKEICAKCEPQNIFLKVVNMSVVILETYVFLLEKKDLKYFPSVATFWAYLFGNFFKDKFFAEGGWETFKLSVVESARHYDQVSSRFEEGYIFTMKDVARIQGLPYPLVPHRRPPTKSKIFGSHAKTAGATQQKQPRHATDCEKQVPAQLIAHGHSEPRPAEHCENVRLKKPCEKICIARESLKLSRNLVANIRKECHSVHPPPFDEERVPPLHPGIEIELPSPTVPEEIGGVRRKTYSRGQSYAQRKLHKESLASTSKQSSLAKEQGCSQADKSNASRREIPYACRKMLPTEQSSIVRHAAREKHSVLSGEQVLTEEIIHKSSKCELPLSGPKESRASCEKLASKDLFGSFNELKLEPNEPASSGLGSSDNLNAAEPFEIMHDIKALERNSLSALSAGKAVFGAAACNLNVKMKTTNPVISKRKNRRRNISDSHLNEQK